MVLPHIVSNISFLGPGPGLARRARKGRLGPPGPRAEAYLEGLGSNEVEVPGSTQMKKLPQSTEIEISRLTKDMNKLMASAEWVAERGDVDGSKFKVMLAEEIKLS